MRRRDFVTLLGGAVAAWPLTTHAQQAGPTPLIGVIMPLSSDDSEAQARLEAIQDRLGAVAFAADQFHGHAPLDDAFVKSAVDMALGGIESPAAGQRDQATRAARQPSRARSGERSSLSRTEAGDSHPRTPSPPAGGNFPRTNGHAGPIRIFTLATKPGMPSRCGYSGESTRPCAWPTVPSPTPSRQPMLRR